jgi:hypothetical protein
MKEEKNWQALASEDARDTLNNFIDTVADTIHKTRFPELGYVHDGPALWRIVDLTDARPSRIGPLYPSRAELLADLQRYAEQYGCA